MKWYVVIVTIAVIITLDLMIRYINRRRMR